MFAQLLNSVEITRFRCFDKNFGFQEQGIVRLPAWCRWGRCNRGCIAAHDIEPLISRSKAPYLRTSTLIVSNNMHTSPFLGSQLQRRAPSAARTTPVLCTCLVMKSPPHTPQHFLCQLMPMSGSKINGARLQWVNSTQLLLSSAQAKK